MNDTYPLVSIITVNYNGKKFIDDFFAAIKQLDYPQDRIELIYVDNGSSDGSSEYVKQNFSWAIVIENINNNYAGANNLGIKKAKGKFVAFLNNDTKVHPLWLKELLAGIMTEPRIGAAGSKLLFMDGRVQSAGHIEYENYQWFDRGCGEDDHGQYDMMTEVPSLCGGAVLYRRECLDDVGGFDEDFNMFLEDVDMAKRCHNKDWSMLYVPKSIVYHHYHGVMTKELEVYYVQRNRLLIVAKHWPQELPKMIIALKDYVKSKGGAVTDEVERMVIDLFVKFIRTHPRSKCVALMPELINALRQHLGVQTDIFKRVLERADRKEQEIREREELFKTALQDFQLLIQKQNGELCGAREALKGCDGRVSQLQAEIKVHEQTVIQGRVLIEDYGKQIILRDETIRDAQNEFAAAKKVAEEEIQKYAQVITDNNALINGLQKQLGAKDALLTALVKDVEQERAAWNEKVKGIEEALSAAETSVRDLQFLCARYEATLQEEKARCEREHVLVIQDLRDELQNKENMFRQKMYEFGERMRGIEEALRAKGKELEDTVREMGLVIRARDEQVQELEQTLQTMGHALRSKDEQLQEQERQTRLVLDEKQRQIIDRDGELHDLDRLLSEKENEILHLNEKVAAFFTSRGYRFVLKPMLDIQAWFKKIIKRHR